MPAVDWTLVLLSGSTYDELGELAPTAVTMRFEKNRGAVIKSMTLPHDAAGAAELEANREFGVPILLAYRRDSLHDDDSPQPRLSVRLDTIVHTLDGDVPVAALTWADPLGLPLATSTNSDDFNDPSGDIVSDLITTENTEAPSGLRMGDVLAGTTTRQKDFNLQPIAAAIYEFADLGDFRLDLTYLDPRDNDGDIAELALVSTTSTDRSATVRLEAGDGTAANTLSVNEQTIPPINKVTATVRHPGAFPGDPNAGATVAYTVSNAASIAKYGKREYTSDVGSVLNDADLGDKARAMLRLDWTRSVQFQPNPDTAPQPWVDYQVGDTIGFLCDSYQLQIDESAEVVALEIDLDENLQEVAHRLEYGEPRKTEQQVIAGLAERVYWLEHNDT